MDLAPTVCELVGGKAHPVWQSSSFAAELKAGQDWGRDELVVSMGVWSCNRSVRWGDWLMMRVYDDGLKPVPQFMLFDVKKDPHQMTNLAAERPEVLNEGLARLERWTTAQLACSPDPVDPMQVVMAEGGPYHTRDELERYCEFLRETGRANCAEELEAKAAARRRGEYRDPRSG
jgi:hypothetical protein